MASNVEMKRKAGRRKDPVWVHVKEEDDGFRCSYCHIFYTGGASRIKSHLWGKAGGGIRPCPSAPSPFPLIEAPKVITTSCSNPLTLPSSDNDSISGQSSFGVEEERRDIDVVMANFLYFNKLPLETVEQPYFRDLITKVAKFEPGYVPPSQRYILEEILDLQREVEQHIKTVRDSWREYGCTVMIHWKDGALDASPSMVMESDIVGFTVYSPKGIVFLKPYDPSTSLSSMEHFINDTRKAMKQYAVQILFNTKWPFLHSNLRESFASDCDPRCCATSLIRKTLNNIIKRFDWICNIVDEANSAYEHLAPHLAPKKSEQNSDLGSKYHYDHHNPFWKLQIIISNKTQLQNIAETTGLSHFIDQENLLKNGEELLHAIAPLIHILGVFRSFFPNIGYCYEAMEKAKIRFQDYVDRNMDKFEPARAKFLFKDFNHKFNFELFIYKFDEELFEYEIAAFLNPGYYFFSNLTDNKSIYTYLEDASFALGKLKQLPIVEEELGEQLEIYGDKDPSLFTEEAILMLRELHPVRWWQKFGSTVVPVLTKAAIRLLSQPANCLYLTSSPDFTLSDTVNINASMMKEISLLKEGEEMFKPIDLSKLDEPLY